MKPLQTLKNISVNKVDERDAIRDAVYLLRKERAEALAEMARTFDEEYYTPNLESLMCRCSVIGHRFNFSSKGVGWYECCICGFTEEREFE